MKKFKDKVAVITGAASGIGMELARLCAKEGMKVVLADIDTKRLHRVERRMKREGATVIAVEADVSDRNYLILQIFYEILRPSDGQNYRIRYRYENAQRVMINITIVEFPVISGYGK